MQITNIITPKENKENQLLSNQILNEQSNNAGSSNPYDDGETKDINSKLSRLQDLLKMAKNT